MLVKKTFDPNKISWGWQLFCLVLAINIVQAVFTPLLNDEPYYWLYAQYPSWGYLDHPPMIALLIRLGSFVLPGAIGLRLLSTLLGSCTFYLAYKIIEAEAGKPVSFKLAALLLLSSIFLNLYSFLAIPDTPMLFFATLFLLAYRKYLLNDGLFNSVSLGIIAALLLYSKYHGILLIGFTLLSNYRLLFKRSFYIVFVVALLLLTPHIYWEIQHNYLTIRFQLFDRGNAFSIQHVLSYLGEQAGVTGPLILLLGAVLYKPKNQFQKSLKYSTLGIFIFFLISSFKEMVNVHWTAITLPGMLCLAYLYISELKINTKFIYGLLTFNLLIVLVLRINFMVNLFSISNFNDKNPAEMTARLNAASKGYPLVFKDMYNEPCYFSFYGHAACFAVNDIGYKPTQFNYLPGLEKMFRGKMIDLVSYDAIDSTSKKIAIQKGKVYYITTIPCFASYCSAIRIKAANFTDMGAATQVKVRISIASNLKNTGIMPCSLTKAGLALTFINTETGQWFTNRFNGQIEILKNTTLDFPFKTPAIKGNYKCIFSVVTNKNLPAGFNSDIYNCKLM